MPDAPPDDVKAVLREFCGDDESAAAWLKGYRGADRETRDWMVQSIRALVDAGYLGRPSPTPRPPAHYTWEFCPSCGGAGWVGARNDHRHPGCGHRCTLCYPPPRYDRTYAVGVTDAT